MLECIITDTYYRFASVSRGNFTITVIKMIRHQIIPRYDISPVNTLEF